MERKFNKNDIVRTTISAKALMHGTTISAWTSGKIIRIEKAGSFWYYTVETSFGIGTYYEFSLEAL